MGEPNGVVAKIEIVLLANGQMGFSMKVPSRYVFNAMMETAKQNGLAELYQREQQKVVAPEPDMSRIKL